MPPELTEATYVADYKIKLKFADGMEGVVDLRSQLWGDVFAPLEDMELFRAFTLNKELHTLCWPTGADLAPEFLYAEATATVGAV